MSFFNRKLLLISLCMGIGKYLFAQENIMEGKMDSSVYVNSRYITPKDLASFQAARLPLKEIENPQVTSIVGNELIANRNLFNQRELLSNATGISQSWASVSPYYNLRGFSVRSYIRNGIDAYLSSEMDPANLESLSVIKGPSGSLFGSTLVSFGGLINRITKKPVDSTFNELSFSGGNNGFYRVSADINSVLDKEHKMLFRLNTAYTDQSSFQDAGFSRIAFLAPSFSYRVNERLHIILESEIQYRRGSSNSQITPLNPLSNGMATRPDNANALNLDYKKSYANNAIYLNNPTINLYGKIQYRLGEHWLSETNLVNTWSENTGNYLTMNLIKGDSSLVRKITNYPDGNMRTQQIQQNFVGDFMIGHLRNRMVIGLDYFQNKTNTSSNGLNGSGMNMGGGMSGMSSASRPAFDTLNLYTSKNNYASLSPSTIDNKLLPYSPNRTSTIQNTYSAYISDMINPTRELSIMLSGRVDRYINGGSTNLSTGVTSGKYNQTSFSPKLGLSYQIIPNKLSAFSNYMNGFQNTAPMTQVDGTVSVFKPQYGNQWESGIKVNLLSQLLDATISYYYINVSNVVRNDPENPTRYIQDGRQYSRGTEIDLQSQPILGLYLHAGATYNDSKYTTSDPTTNNLRPINAGPKYTGNWYASYQITKGSIKGFGIGFGGNYYGKNLIINTTTAGTFYTNPYTLLNAQLHYDKSKYAFAISMSNLSNRHYYYGGMGFITPGQLRQIIASIKLKF